MDIQVGQQWRTREGREVKIAEYDVHDKEHPWGTEDQEWYTANGRYYGDTEDSRHDLMELLTPPAPDTLRLTIAASIYASMLEGNYLPVAPTARHESLRNLARRALSHADILIQEAAR